MTRKQILAFTVAWLVMGGGSSFARPAPSPLASDAHSATAATPAPRAAGLASVEGVSIRSSATGQETQVDISVTPLPQYHVFQLEDPPRLVVDIAGARKLTPKSVYLAHSPLLERVRVARFSEEGGGTIRVVADLTGQPLFDVHAQPGGLRIELKSRAAAAQATQPLSRPAPPTTAQAASPSPQGATVPQPAPVKADPQAESQVATAPAAAAGASTRGMDYQNALPAAPGSAGVTAAPKSVAQAAGTGGAAQAAHVLAAENLKPQAPAASQQPAAASPPTQYTGEPISLNLKDVDIKDFFRLIHEISGLNIIVDPDVSGSVTMVLDNVPWDQALDLVLQQNGLGRTLEGNILRIAKLSTLASEQQEAQKLAAAKVEAAPLVTVFRPINYAKAATVAALLKSWTGGGAITARGNILVDDRTNTLIISDIGSQIPIIQNIIDKLDTKAKQVSIEARIVRANTDFTRQLQSALAFASINSTGHTVNAGATGQGVGATTATTTSGTGGSAISAPVTAGSAAGFGVYFLRNQAAQYIVNAALAALENKDEAKTISRPSIVTQNNVKGSVVQGVQIPIQTTINNTISITYVQASLEMDVTPQVTHDGNIFLDIQVTNASVGAILTTAGPSINTQKATTQVLVPDGGTVVFGGVTITTRSKSASFVPLLGNIPILGHLFKNSNVSSNDQELLFFVTPKVLTS